MQQREKDKQFGSVFVFGGKRYNEILFMLGRRRFDENFKLILETAVW